MSLDDWHLVFVFICLVLVLTAFSPVVMAYLRMKGEPFLAIAVLGEKEIAEHYFPGDDPDIDVEEEVHWTIYLYNHMGKALYVAVRVKLLNSTMLDPSSTTFNQSPSPIVYEVRRTLLNNETWLYPFNWSLIKVSLDGNSTIIEGLMINGEPIQTKVSAKNGYNFRMVFETWIYDETLKDFIFGFVSKEHSDCFWNQIWFNVTHA